MAGAPPTANMGLQANHRPTAFVPQGTSGQAEMANGENLVERAPPLVANSLSRTVFQQNGIETSQLLETEYQGSTSTNNSTEGDVEKWRFVLESTDFISPSECFLKMKLQWRSANPSTQTGQFGVFECKPYPVTCDTSVQFAHHGEGTVSVSGTAAATTVAAAAKARNVVPWRMGALCGHIAPFATHCLFRQFSVKMSNNSFTEDCDPKMSKFGLHMMMCMNNSAARLDQLADYIAGKYEYSLFPRKDEHQYLSMLADWADGTAATNTDSGGLLAFGKAQGVAADTAHYPLIKGQRLLAQRCLYGEKNADLLSDYNAVFFPTLGQTEWNEDTTYSAEKKPTDVQAHGNDVWVYYKPMFTIFKSDQLIPPGTKLEITIDTAQRDPNETSLMYRFPSAGTAVNGYVNDLPNRLSVYWAIKRFIFMTRVYRLTPETHAALMSHFNQNGFAYAMPLMTVRRQIINTNSSNSSTFEVWNGRIPERFLIKFVDTRVIDGNGGDTVPMWCRSTFPRNNDGTVALSELDVRYNDVSLFANPLEFDYESTAGGKLLKSSTSATLVRTDQVLRQGRRAAFGQGIKRLELLLQQFMGTKDHDVLPFTRHDLADGQFMVPINMDPSGGPYNASVGNWGSIKVRLVFKSTDTKSGISPEDNLSMLFIGFTRRHIYQSFSGVTSSNFSGGLAQQ